MKKISKTLSLVSLCALMIIMSIVPAFAADTRNGYTYVEDQSFMNCYNRYIDNDGSFVFNIRVKSGYLNSVTYSVYGSLGSLKGEYNFAQLCNSYTVTDIRYNDNGYDYFTLKKNSTYPGAPKDDFYGMGVRLFYNGYYNGNHIMATNTSNGSTEIGQGYFLYR